MDIGNSTSSVGLAAQGGAHGAGRSDAGGTQQNQLLEMLMQLLSQGSQGSQGSDAGNQSELIKKLKQLLGQQGAMNGNVMGAMMPGSDSSRPINF